MRDEAVNQRGFSAPCEQSFSVARKQEQYLRQSKVAELHCRFLAVPPATVAQDCQSIFVVQGPMDRDRIIQAKRNALGRHLKGWGPEKDVCRLDVPVQNFTVVDIFYGTAELKEPMPDDFLPKQSAM